MVLATTLIQYHTYRQTHRENTGINGLTHKDKYKLTPPATCTHQLPVLQ